MNPPLQIDHRAIGPGQRTLIIAEIGVNHDGVADRAIELAEAAAAAGADAVKLQVFCADSLVHGSSRLAEYQKGRVNESDPAAMLRRLELTHEELARIVHAIRKLNLLPLATPFSPRDVSVIQELSLPAIKIASPDLVNKVLLARAARLGKPMIVSTGAATMDEVAQAAQWLQDWRVQFALMHCVSSYPTSACDAHLCWIADLARFGALVGYSDHTTDLLAGALAVGAGACVIEKHLTYDRNAQGPDHAASADPGQFAEYVRLIRNAEDLRGTPGKHVLPVERDVRTVSRQSLVLARGLARGEVLREQDLTVQRPGTGIAPAELDAVVGLTLNSALPKGTMLQWEMLGPRAASE